VTKLLGSQRFDSARGHDVWAMLFFLWIFLIVFWEGFILVEQRNALGTKLEEITIQPDTKQA
jgi:hypothetical protein